MTKLTKAVRATIRDVAEQNDFTVLSGEMRAITIPVVREVLREQHGINVRVRDLRRVCGCTKSA